MELSAMRFDQSIRRARICTVAAAIVCVSVSAFGQSGQPSLSNAVQAAARTTAMQPSTSVRRLSIDDATRLALEQNLGIRIQRVDPQIQDVGVWQARSFWAPNFTTSFNKNSNSQPAQSAILPSFQNGTLSSGVGLNEVLPWGGSYSANWNNQRLTSTNILNNFSPQLQSALNVNYTQPLLRNFSFDQIRQQVQNSKKVRDLSDIQLRGVVTGTMRNVKNAYWDLVYAINNLKAQQQSLALSQQSLKDNQKRVEIGTMAPIDIVQAQAEVASNDQGVIIADANIKQAQDNLRALILDPGAPDFWTVEFEPTDEPAFSEQPIDVDEAVRNALSKRSDLMSAKNSLEQSDVNIKYYKNQVLPDVNASVNYGTFGVGGTQLTPVDLALAATGLAPNRAILAQRGYGTVLGDVFGSAYPQWSVGVQFGYPIGASTAQANLARVKLQYEEAQMQMKNVELQITTQVRAVARNVQTNQKRVQSARASRELQQKKLEAEEKKLAAGMSSTFFVFQAQRDLSIARVVEIQAIADYNKSLVDFQAVQEVPVGGGFGGITTAGTGAISTGGSLIIRQ
jgi:outer membrane protein